MSSPFPGMNPFLEGPIWPQVHAGLIYGIKKSIAGQLPDDLTVESEVFTLGVSILDEGIQEMYPDLGIIEGGLQSSHELNEPETSYGATTPASIKIKRRAIKQETLRVIDLQSRDLITTIELLSPVNKYGSGFQAYLKKRDAVLTSNTNLLEIDLLRRGRRAGNHPVLQKTDYCAILYRTDETVISVWTMGLQDRLPILPVPLRPADDDLRVDLQEQLNVLYEDVKLGKSIDYSGEIPPPVVEGEKLEFVQNIVSNYK